MVTILKKGADLKAIEKINKELNERQSRRGLNAIKYCGIIDIKEDGLALQKRLRNEWE